MSTFKFENNVQFDLDVEYEFDNISKVIETTSNDVRVVAITSSKNDEGKSFVSFHVACALAKKGYRCIVLMADMRKTTIKHDKTIMGIVDIINGKAEIDEIIYNTDIEDVDVIFSGATKKNEKLNIDRRVYSVMLKCLKDEYNYIIIDMATLEKTDNDDVFLKEADAGILVIQPNRSSKKRIEKNIKLLEQYNCRVLGAIINNK